MEKFDEMSATDRETGEEIGVPIIKGADVSRCECGRINLVLYNSASVPVAIFHSTPNEWKKLVELIVSAIADADSLPQTDGGMVH